MSSQRPLFNGARLISTAAAPAQDRRLRRRKVFATLGALLIAAAPLVSAHNPASAATSVDVLAAKQLSVDLSTKTKESTGVGLGILYGITQDGLQPSDQLLDPLKLNAFRSGGWYSGGWIRDNFKFGAATQANIDAVIAEARRLQRPPRQDLEFQVLLSDVFGSTGGAPASTLWPCTRGDCSNWISFIDATVTRLQASGHDFTYEIWNEPDLSIFWRPGVNTPQYFQMWDSAYREIRRLAPDATIAGPSFAFTPERQPQEWQTFLAHAKAAGTVPDEITNHNEGDIDDPVTVGRSLANALNANGIAQRPLSSNEYQPADRQTAGDTAWYNARLAQSNYANAMRGNWKCCTIPNLTGLLTQTSTGWAPNGNWWVMRTYADLTGTLVSTSGQVGSTAISASEDPAENRVVALIGDIQGGYVGPMAVNVKGLSAAPWLVRDGLVHATVYRIPDQGPLLARQVVFSQNVQVNGDTVAVPFDFQSKHDAYGIYLSSSEQSQQCGIGDSCEAEDGTLAGGACLATDHPGYTGTGFVACFTTPGGNVTQRIVAESAGAHTLDLRYAAGPNGPAGTRSASVSVNGGAPQRISLPLTGSWNTWRDAAIPVNLLAGSNTIKVAYNSGDAGWFNLDHLVVTH